MKFILSLILIAGSFGHAATLKSLNGEKFPIKLPKLEYVTDSLAIAIDKETMEIHHGKHHKAYVDNANKVMPKEKKSVLEILKTVSQYPAAVKNNVGGHWNHAFFWKLLTPDTKNQMMPERLQKEIESAFGSVDAFKAEIEKQGASRFGSGWVWVIRNAEKKLEITATEYQDNPLMDTATVKGIPVLGIDVWEHAYYLKYQNKRADYLKGIWSVFNWKQVNDFDIEALKM